jgi:hypothetical protein
MPHGAAPPPWSRVGTRVTTVLLLALLLAGVGCGRRATELDCRLIVDKSVELQLRETNQTNADAIEKREQQVRAELEQEIHSCEGRRVTEKTMACVTAATSTQGLDTCLR